MDYSRLFNALRRWWFVVLACVLVGLVISLAYIRLTPAKYTARADVMLVVGGETAIDLSSGSSFAQQQARNLSVIATRQRVVEPVIRRLSLPETASGLTGSITATVPVNTSIVTLQVSYPDAAKATAIANALADSLAQNATDLLPTVKKGGAVINLRTVYQDSPPTGASSPSTATALVLGVGGGLVIGIALILLFEFISASRRTSAATTAIQPQPAYSTGP